MMIAFSGFGGSYSSPDYLSEGEWATGTIDIGEEMYFPTAFVMPNTTTLQSVQALFSTASQVMFQDGVVIRPFICIAVCNSGDLVYTILQQTMTYTEPYLGGVEYPRHTIRRGSTEGLDIEIAEGTLVAIIAGIMADNVTDALNGTFSVSGGLYMQ